MQFNILDVLLSLTCLGLLIWSLEVRRAKKFLEAEVRRLDEELVEATKKLEKYEKTPDSKLLGTVVDILAAAGIPGLVLLAAMAVSGFTGAAGITVALASLGGPAGMLGGIGLLITMGVAIAKSDISTLSARVVAKLLNVKTKTALVHEINSLPSAIPAKFRDKARLMLDEGRES